MIGSWRRTEPLMGFAAYGKVTAFQGILVGGMAADAVSQTPHQALY
jgi:hypothetical protein